MKIHTDIIQGTAEWRAIRAGKVTASELDALLTPEFKIKTGKGPESYLAKKVAEAMIGGPLPDEDFSSFHTENGQILEEDARRYYCFNFDHAKLTDAGFVEHDSGRFGCSPDALIGDDSGLEIKAPMLKTHTKYLLSGELPDDYAVQVHGCMYATGRPRWEFMSYPKRLKLPVFHLVVERDEAIQAQIEKALTAFYAKFDAAMVRLQRSK